MADFTDQFNTQLTPTEERQFADWVMRQRAIKRPDGRQFDPLADIRDYDIKGWWKKSGGNIDLSGGHLTDEFKKPNHPTFSNESKYHGVDGYEGGTWGGSEGNWTFTPGKTNLQFQSADELQDYFQRIEPDAKVLMPEPAGAQ